MISAQLEELRCTNCNRLLFRGIMGLGFIEAKCSRCGAINLLHSLDNILLNKPDTYILVFDTSGRVTIASHNAGAVLGYEDSELIHLPLEEICAEAKGLPPLPHEVDGDALSLWEEYHKHLPDMVKHRRKDSNFVTATARFYPLLSANGIYSMGVFKIISSKA